MCDQLTITKEKVLKAAETCGAANETLKALFPEAFKPEPFDFSDGIKIDSCVSNPMYVGFGFAPDGFSGRCLVVGPTYKMEISEHGGRTILTFYKK